MSEEQSVLNKDRCKDMSFLIKRLKHKIDKLEYLLGVQELKNCWVQAPWALGTQADTEILSKVGWNKPRGQNFGYF